MTDVVRSAAPAVRHLLTLFPIVVLIGPKRCGKRRFARQIMTEAPFFDMDFDEDLMDLRERPNVLNGDALIFELQQAPELWPLLAQRIAADPKRKGRYLVTLSGGRKPLAELEQVLGSYMTTFELGGLHLEELDDREPSYLYELVATGDPESLFSLTPDRNNEALYQACLHGFFPEAYGLRHRPEERTHWLKGYYRNYISGELAERFPGLKLRAFYSFLKMLGVASGSVRNASNIARSLELTTPTILKYIEIAEDCFLWRPIPAFPYSGGKRLVKAPKGHLRDTGLINMMLDIHDMDDLKGHVHLASIWSAMVMEMVLRGFENRLLPVRAYHYATHNKAEVDLVLEGDFGLVPVDVRLGARTTPNQHRMLNAFVQEYQCPYGLVINSAEKVKRISEHLIQVPATCL